MFLFMFMYVCAILLIFFWGAKEQWELSKDAPFRWYITIARGFGYTLNLNCALVILLACRLLFTSIRATWLNLLIPFDKIFPKFHIIVGYFVAGAVFFHAAFHIVWVAGWKQWSGGVYGITMTMTTGFILAAILLVMVITSMPRIRSKSFTWFYHFHTFGAALFFILLLVHGVYNGSLYTYKWIVAPIVIYCIDRVARNIKMATACLKLDDDSFTVRGDVVRIALNKPFDYRAGHYAGMFDLILFLFFLFFLQSGVSAQRLKPYPNCWNPFYDLCSTLYMYHRYDIHRLELFIRSVHFMEWHRKLFFIFIFILVIFSPTYSSR